MANIGHQHSLVRAGSVGAGLSYCQAAERFRLSTALRRSR
jgi:hypothetical protein